MVICYIIGCKSRTEQKLQDITFHTFPKDSAIRQLWIRATGQPNWQPTKYTRICSRHFKQSCFRKTARNMTCLKPFSIPTLHIVEQVPMEILSTSIELPVDIPSTSHHIPMQIDSIPTQVENSESMEIEMTPRKQKLLKQLNRKNKITNKKTPLHYLVQECLKKCIGLKLFNNKHDYSDRPIFENHYSLLIKSISKKYLNVRIHYATKSFTNKIDNIRNMYTKLIIFKGQ